MKKLTAPKSTAQKTISGKLGPGEYVPDVAYQRIEDLPQPKVIKQSRNVKRRPCPHCGQPAPRDKTFLRALYDVGDLVSGRPRLLHITYSQHYCSRCRKYFNTDLSDIAARQCLYTRRVQSQAVRLVVEV
jgi:transposase